MTTDLLEYTQELLASGLKNKIANMLNKAVNASFFLWLGWTA